METEGPPAARASTARELASTPVVAVEGRSDAMAALQEMDRRNIHHLAVVSGDAPVGLVSATDLLFGIAAEEPGEPVHVDVVCLRPAPEVDAEASAAVAAQRMIGSRSDALLVRSHGEVLGVLTAVDLVRALGENPVANPPGPDR